jgi:hypothetical protein
MVTIPSQCWQVAAGDGDRHYADLCLEHGVILMGPSTCGDWKKVTNKKGQLITARGVLEDGGWSAKKIKNLETFVFSIAPDDLVILRIGKSEVHGVGIVRTPYEFNPLFSDVDGWNIAHTHRVEWIWKRTERKKSDEGNFKDALNFGDTTQRLDIKNPKTALLFEWIKSLPEPVGQPLPTLPRAGKEIESDEISRHLFDYGISFGSLSGLEAKIKDLCSLAQWYSEYQQPSESETVAHLVVPLLLALGWTPQRIALEFHQSGKGRADLALYANGNRSKYKPIVLIEAKKYKSSCMTAEPQVKSYSEKVEDVRRLVVTDGIRYGIFIRNVENKLFPKTPTAYLNLADLRDDYPIYGDCKGADEALLYLSAAWSHQFTHPSVQHKRDFEQ